MPKKNFMQPTLRPLEEAEIAEVHRRQAELLPEIAEIFDNKPPWNQLTLAQLKEKVAEEQKKPHTVMLSIYSGDELVGIAVWSANWDSWTPYAWMIIWPEHRRKGIGTAIARTLMVRSFLESPGHAMVTLAADWDSGLISFIKTLGFKEIGRMRRTHMLEGDYHDTLFFDMLKSEYLAKGAGK